MKESCAASALRRAVVAIAGLALVTLFACAGAGGAPGVT